MLETDWDSLHVGATIHLSGGNFYVRVVELLGTEKSPGGIGEIWDRNNKKLTKDSWIMGPVWSNWQCNYTPCPTVRPVIENKVILPGDPLWPKVTRYLFKGERLEHEYTQEDLDLI